MNKFKDCQEIYGDKCASFNSGFNARVDGDSYADTFYYSHERNDIIRRAGWEDASRLISNGEIYSKSHRTEEAIKVFKDGDKWCCVGEGFEDLMASDNYAFGDSSIEAATNYFIR